MKKFKKILSLALCLCMSVGIYAPAAFATANEVPQPYWTNTETVSVNLRFSNGQAIVAGDVTGRIGTTKIHATFTLEKKNANGVYTNVAIWSTPMTYDQQLFFTDQCAVTRGEFRVTISANVTRNGTTENVSATNYATY